MHATDHYPRTEGRLIDISGLIGCAGVLLLQWTIGFVLMGDRLYGQTLWTPLTWLTGQLAQAVAGPQDAATAWLHIHYALWTLQVALFAAIYWRLMYSREKLPPRRLVMLLSLQLMLAVSDGDVLPKILAMELPLLFPLRRALKWLAASWLLAMLCTIPYLFSLPDGPGYIDFVRIYVSFLREGLLLDVTFFAFGVLAAKEKRGRSDLEQAHVELAGTYAELVTAQQQLADRVRASERVRIAQQLHEVIDERLSSQSRHLEKAMQHCDDAILPSVKTAHELSLGLLGEVRRLVDAEQGDPSINLHQALDTLCSGIPSPRITLAFDDAVNIANPATANAVFRCVQEAISNAVRHANASELHISLMTATKGIAVRIADNGVGMGTHEEGSGLTGMRERIDALGGKLAKGNRPGGGFALDLWLPND